MAVKRLVENYAVIIFVLYCLFVYFVIVNHLSEKQPSYSFLQHATKKCHISDCLIVDHKIESLHWSLKKVRPKCELPLTINHSDDFVKPYLNNVYKMKCPRNSIFTFVDFEKGILKLTPTAIIQRIMCHYSFIYRGENDESIVYSHSLRLPKHGVKLTSNNHVANVSCYDVIDQQRMLIYENTHLWIPDFPKTTAKGPSVLVFVIESLSRNSFLRFMPQTQSAMKTLNYFSILEGLTKVGVNSFPNSMAMIANEAVSNELYSPDFWDAKLDYIWNDYKKRGYVTAFVEDFVKIGLFDYCKKGFSKPPTDFYPRSFWLQQFVNFTNLYDEMKNESRYCFHQFGTKIEKFCAHLVEFARKMKRNDQPYFMYSFYSQVTHEDFNNFKLVDEYVAQFLDEISPYLSNTILIVLGDHGPRNGLLVDTPLGKLETRLPFFSIRIPEALHIKYPHLRKLLNYNSKRLTSWFDIYQLLKDVAKGDFDYIEDTQVLPLNPSRQLISPKRTCRDAGIPSVWCVCDRHLEVDQDDVGYHLKGAADTFKEVVHQIVSSHCNLSNIGNASVYDVYLPRKNESLSLIEKVQVGISLNNSTIKARMKRTAKDLLSDWTEWIIDEDVTSPSRLKDAIVHKYCKLSPKNKNR